MEISLKNVQFYYKKINYSKKIIFDDFDIKISDGINFIIGSNGSGKTTLLNILSGDLKINEGEIIIPKAKKIGYVREEFSFIGKTVREELIYSMMENNYRISEKRIIDVLIMVGLDLEFIDTNISKLSVFQKRLLQLASSLIFNPSILLVDNFMNDLDDKNKNNVIKILKLLKKRYNKLLIISTNDLDIAHKIADRVYVLYEGKLVLEGNKYDVFKQEKVLKKYLLSSPNIIKFENLVLDKKNIKLGYRDEINDLIKDIFRNTY